MLNRLLIVLLLTLTFAACDKVVEERVISEDIHPKVVSCQKFGVCPTYSMNAKGDYTYKLGVSSSCPGERNATVKTVTKELTWESGAKTISRFDEVLSYNGSCQ